MGVLDKIIKRCPRLGHEIGVKYCIREKGELPCDRLLVCWGTYPSLIKLFYKVFGEEIINSLTSTQENKLSQIINKIENST